MKTIELPELTSRQYQSWVGLLELANKLPTGWTLIGGQLVQLHCWENDKSPARITTDIDTVLNVVSNPDILNTFTGILKEIGFIPSTSPAGLQYKWIRDLAEIDVLLMDNIGEQSLLRKGITGAPSTETPGGRKVLEFSEKIEIRLKEHRAVINRPSLVGALFIKSAAGLNTNDIGRDRHLIDFAVLTTLINGEMSFEISDSKVLNSIRSLMGSLRNRRDLLATIDGAKEGLDRLEIALS
jgi:hypothetical protein